MKRLSKKEEARLTLMSLQAVIGLGAIPDEHDDPETGYRSFRLETVHGTLRLFPHAEAIRTRFDQVPKIAPEGTSLNPYSGKWNFEFYESRYEDELAHAIRSISAIKVIPAGFRAYKFAREYPCALAGE